MRPAAVRGFTLVEAGVVLAILGVLLAIGVPAMQNWVLARQAVSAAGFYKDGLMLARSQAVAHNSASRLVLIDNANGQMDWRVDLCYPSATSLCDPNSDSWSTPTAAAKGDPDLTAGFRSIERSASAMPASSALVIEALPLEAEAVYFTPLGWVDGRVSPRLMRIMLTPSRARSGAFMPVAVALPLAGNATVCYIGTGLHSAKACPPGTTP